MKKKRTEQIATLPIDEAGPSVHGNSEHMFQKYTFIRRRSNPHRQLVTPINRGILSKQHKHMCQN